MQNERKTSTQPAKRNEAYEIPELEMSLEP